MFRCWENYDSVVVLSENIEGLKEFYTDDEQLPQDQILFRKRPIGDTTTGFNDNVVLVGNAAAVQGIEFDRIFVFIDSNLSFDGERVVFGDEGILLKNSDTRDYLTDEIKERVDFGKSSKWWVVSQNLVEAIENRNINDEDAEMLRRQYDEGFNRYKSDMLEIVKRRYRVLLTRGMKKCYNYAQDENLRTHFMEEANEN